MESGSYPAETKPSTKALRILVSGKQMWIFINSSFGWENTPMEKIVCHQCFPSFMAISLPLRNNFTDISRYSSFSAAEKIVVFLLEGGMMPSA